MVPLREQVVEIEAPSEAVGLSGIGMGRDSGWAGWPGIRTRWIWRCSSCAGLTAVRRLPGGRVARARRALAAVAMPASMSVPVTRAARGQRSGEYTRAAADVHGGAARRRAGRLPRIQPRKCSSRSHRWRAPAWSSRRWALASAGFALPLTFMPGSLPRVRGTRIRHSPSRVMPGSSRTPGSRLRAASASARRQELRQPGRVQSRSPAPLARPRHINPAYAPDTNDHRLSEHSRRTAGVCAFSLTSRITQRDGTAGRDAPGSRTLLYPGDPGPHRPARPRRSRASGRLPEPRPAR